MIVGSLQQIEIRMPRQRECSAVELVLQRRSEDLASRHGLSAREQQLLRLLSRGADTQDIAEEMTISEYTVQDHLKSIFGKTSLTSRNAVLSAALGPGPTG